MNTPLRLYLVFAVLMLWLTPTLCGADVNADLQDAVRAGNIAAVEQALRSGADPNYIPEKGFAPMLAAIMFNKPSYLALLLRYGGDPHLSPDDTPLIYMAIVSNRLESVELLLDAGVPTNQRMFDSQFTPLSLASARARSPALVRLVLERGADPNERPERGHLPLYAAALNKSCNEPCIKLLLEYGANPDGHIAAGPTRFRDWVLNRKLVNILELLE
ncbi:ankyrin repeat domain-containing protein [Thioalkalivibrio sulfidiphilus]|uniref:ankyrin repeat domain-containing protein n=1 Tax=Thioalkalivibrio sulfidiphilus TaxID=1033854 RepID=UPI003B2F628A